MQHETKKILIGTAIIVLVGAIVVYLKLQATGDVASPSPADVPLTEQYTARTIAKNKLEDLDSPSAPFHWISVTDASQGISFERPNRLPVEAKYSTFEFRGFGVTPATFSCKEGRVLDGYPVVTALVMINGRQYCRTTSSDAAMNHSYAYSSYMTELSGKLVTFNFAIVTASCGVYDEVRMAQCKKEREAYSYAEVNKMVEDIVDKMVASVKFTQEKVTFDVPATLGLEYHQFIQNGDKPETNVSIVTTSNFSCESTSSPEKVIERVINGRKYCVARFDDVAAGSYYPKYQYTASIDGKYITFGFQLKTLTSCRTPNWSAEKLAACEAEKSRLDSFLDSMVDKMVASVKFTQEKVTFDVPTELGLKYYSVSPANVGWPPRVMMTSEVYSCKVEKIPTVGETQERIISDRRYCVMSESDGSTGYHLFSYRTMIGDKYARIDFIVWGGRCGPISDPSERDACSNESKILASKVDNMVDGIVKSIKIAK